MKYWEIITDNLSKAGWVGAAFQRWIPTGRTISIGDTHRNDGSRFVARYDNKHLGS